MTLNDFSSFASNMIFLTFLTGIPLHGFLKGVKVYESFVEGAKEGFEVAVRLIPYLVAILVAVGMFRASGALDLLAKILPECMKQLGLTTEVMSLILVRPLSGSAALGILAQIIGTYGPDSYQARLASVIVGSTETTLYVTAVYFGAVSISRMRYAVHAGLLADAAGIGASILFCYLFFK